MSGMTAVAARIAEIQGTLLTLAPPATVTTRAPAAAVAYADSTTDAAGGTDRPGFAAQLAALTDPPPARGSGPTGADVVADAKRYLGIPYRWGGTDPATGLDCSGFTQRVFKDLGITLPRVVAQQKDAGREVASMSAAQPGDLLVFGVGHIGIYLGDGQMVAAPKSGDVVKIQKVYDTPTTIRRLIDDEPATSAIAAPAADTVRPTALRASPATAFDQLFADATNRYDLPAGLLKSVARAESGLDPTARSRAGAIGLMQIMPGTARELGVDPRVPAQAVDGAARLLRSHLADFGSVPLALAAYNAGPGAVRRYDGIPPYGETQAYVRRVQSMMQGAGS